ncbi:MAG TPA: FtsW/RodA/SpoVE family cell cycle protein, partial [Acidimicrobiales bacterium]|nr:FtsW/RodA/SpoVE family cell cycle protein [Acidimicrobiales bacterium]
MALLATLCIIGLVMVGSASPIISMSLYGSSWGILIRQVMWMGLGIVAFYVLSRVDYRKWRRIRVPLLIGTLVLLVVVLVPGIGVTS